MTDKIIIADAGPLIAFGKISQISLLVKTLGEIIVPDAVLKECLVNPAHPGAKEIASAVNKKRVKSQKVSPKHNLENLFEILGEGEASAIALAVELKAGLLIDEKLGRKVAQKMQLKIIGTAGVILLAKNKKLIKKL